MQFYRSGCGHELLQSDVRRPGHEAMCEGGLSLLVSRDNSRNGGFEVIEITEALLEHGKG
jgi:hypothetical protein